MKKLAIVSAIILSASLPAAAADLIVEDPAIADPLVLSGFYANVLGGVALGGIVDHNFDGGGDHDHDLEGGMSFSAAVGYQFDNGLGVEVDLFHTSRDEDGYDYGLATTSLMAGVRYTVDLTDMISVYGGVGVGGIWTNDLIYEDKTTGLGYQLKAGVEVAVTENLALVGEYRYQDAFADMPGEEYADFANRAPVHAVMAGLKLSF